MSKRYSLKDNEYGRLIVLRRDEERSDGNYNDYWICQCRCGKETSVRGASLRSGNTESCGCLRNEKSSDRLKARRAHLSKEGRAALDKIAANCKMTRAELIEMVFTETEQRLAAEVQ